MVLQTANGLRYPEPADANDYPTHMQQQAEDTDVRLPFAVADVAERDAIPSGDRYDGLVVWVVASGLLQQWDGSAWRTISAHTALSTHKTDEVHDQPQTPQAHSHDYLALDGSNSPTGRIDWGGHQLSGAVLNNYAKLEDQNYVDNGVITISFNEPVVYVDSHAVDNMTEIQYQFLSGSGTWQSVLLWLEKACPNSVTWPSNTGFEGGTAPDLSQGANFLVLNERDSDRVAVWQMFANLSGVRW